MAKKVRELDPKRQSLLENRRKTRAQRYSSYRKTQKGEEKAKTFFPTFKRVAKYILNYKFAFFVVALTCVFSTVCNVLGPKYIGGAIDVLGEEVETKLAGGVINPESLFLCVGQLILIYGSMALLMFIQHFVMAGTTAKVVRKLREDINKKLSSLPLKYFDGNAKGDILSRVVNDVMNISNSLQHNMVAIITSAISIVGVLGMMIYENWFLTLVIMCVVPIGAGVALGIMRISKRLFKQQWDRTGELNGHVEEMYTGQKIVKLFGQKQLSMDEFNDINDDLTYVSCKAQFVSGMVGPFVNLMDNVAYILIAVIGSFLIINNGVLSIGDFVIYDTGRTFTLGGILTFITYTKLFTSPISQLAQIVNSLQSSMASAERVFDLLDEQSESPDKNEKLEFNSSIKFEDVSFSYSDDKPLMEHLNLEVKKGSLIALVGPTGAGKTTFVNLLMRFYDVTGGKITIDGTDIRDVKRDDLRSLYGMVLQDTWLFKGTVMDNLRYGRLDATDEEVIEAAKASRADDFIKDLPEGYYTLLSENGDNISQGQRQLLTIARALLKNPQILILDEATSSVDTRTELLLQEAMGKIMEGRTNFVIAHRLSTIKKADKILFIDKGAVKEWGTHEELLAKGGLYADMYNSQFGGKVSDKTLNTDY